MKNKEEITNKMTQWREEWQSFVESQLWQGEDNYTKNMAVGNVADFFITKHLDTLELLEKEVEERMNNLKCTCPVGVVCDCGVERAYQALSDVLAIIRQHKEK